MINNRRVPSYFIERAMCYKLAMNSYPVSERYILLLLARINNVMPKTITYDRLTKKLTVKAAQFYTLIVPDSSGLVLSRFIDLDTVELEGTKIKAAQDLIGLPSDIKVIIKN